VFYLKTLSVETMSRRWLIEAAGVRALIDDVFQISCTVFYFV